MGVRPRRFDHEVEFVSAVNAARQTVGHIEPNEQGCDVMQPTDALRVEILQQEHRARTVPCQREREQLALSYLIASYAQQPGFI